MLLIVTFEEDPQANQLVLQLRDLGFTDFLRLDMGKAFERNSLDFCFENGQWKWQISVLEAPELVVSSEDLRTVFYRRAMHPSLARKISFPSAADIDISQTYTALHWLLNTLPREIFPFGTLDDLMQAENKFLQLKFAAEAGMTVMPTQFSTHPEIIAEFARREKHVVVKSLGAQSLYETNDNGQEVLNIFGATVLKSAQVEAALEEFEHAQLYLQSAVPKVAEHRITAIPGGQFIDCRIDTSKLPEGEIDYRLHINEVPHEIVELPDDLRPKLQRYLEMWNIQTGCFDFAELADGQMVFFECNPLGEWMWIEQLTDYPITRSIAEVLVKHHEKSCQ